MYRVGKKQKRAVLDERGIELVIFPVGKEKQAQEYCDFLNSMPTNKGRNNKLIRILKRIIKKLEN